MATNRITYNHILFAVENLKLAQNAIDKAMQDMNEAFKTALKEAEAGNENYAAADWADDQAHRYIPAMIARPLRDKISILEEWLKANKPK